MLGDPGRSHYGPGALSWQRGVDRVRRVRFPPIVYTRQAGIADHESPHRSGPARLPEGIAVQCLRCSAVVRWPVLIPAVLLLLTTVAAQASGQRIFAGEAVAVGEGIARVVTVQNPDGTPASVAVVLSRAALEGLPGPESGHAAVEYVLPMPVEGPWTGYDHVGLDWNPVGHIPEGVYSVAHFDVHFYTIGQAERAAITFTGADRERALAPPDSDLVPAGYVIPPDSAVERMGLHGLDPGGHEFHGKPFSYSFLYGYYTGRLIFVEPMIAVDWLRTRPDVTVPVKTPSTYSMPGYYPDRYRIGFDAERDEYRVALLGLRPHGVARSAAR